MKESIEQITRALVYNNKRILLCENIDRGHYFLPGGHIEENELPEEALEREFFEESKSIVTDIKFIRFFDNKFEQSGNIVQERLYVHLTKIKDNDVKSREKHIRFRWVLLNDLDKVKFFPEQLTSDIISMVKNNKKFWK